MHISRTTFYYTFRCVLYKNKLSVAKNIILFLLETKFLNFVKVILSSYRTGELSTRIKYQIVIYHSNISDL